MIDPIYRLRYVSPRGDEILMNPRSVEGPYFLISTEGLSRSGATPSVRSGPVQPGSTLTAVGVQPRVVAVQLAVFGRTEAEYWDRRQALVDALNEQVSGEDPTLGTLVISRFGKPDLHLRCIPQDSPVETGRTDRLGVRMDVEFFAPNPYFRSTNPFQITLQTDGGFTFPLEHPWESVANRSDQTVANPGTVRSPIVATLHGEFTNGRLVNQTTGESIVYVGTVQAGDRVIITTEYGRKRAIHIDSSGVETNAMPSLDLTETDFWEMVRGNNDLLFEADLNPSGYAEVQWRPQYGGL